jgi:NADPH-dependent 2,4-dienoyl-CoA reductase/sulfur reductase-like enzyme
LRRILIIGGSDAGTSAALRAREVDPAARVTMVVADRYPNYSICGLPFYLSGEVGDWHALAHRTASELEGHGIELLLERRAAAIDPAGRTVTVAGRRGRAARLPYDRLIVGTGAVAVRPAFAPPEVADAFSLRWMDDAHAVKGALAGRRPDSAVIVGSGYIGVEMADALTRAGLKVRMLARRGEVLRTIDPPLQRLVRAELQRNGVEVIDGIEPGAVESRDGKLVLRCSPRESLEADLVLLATGAMPESSLARAAGLETGIRGAIRVGRGMETGVEGIWAAGDCAETWHALLLRPVYLPLGTTAHKQGRVAGENAAGGAAEFAGSLGTQVVKIFELVVARTGLKESEALAEGFEPLTIQIETPDHKAYYPGATPLHIRLVGDRPSGRLLGAQIAGDRRAEIAKRIDILATALFHGMTVGGLLDLDLSYTPPLSAQWDPVQAAALAWLGARTPAR